MQTKAFLEVAAAIVAFGVRLGMARPLEPTEALGELSPDVAHEHFHGPPPESFPDHLTSFTKREHDDDPPNLIPGIGVVNGSLQIVDFARENLPRYKRGGSSYEITIGLRDPRDKERNGPGGKMPEVVVYDKRGRQTGWRLNYAANTHVAKEPPSKRSRFGIKEGEVRTQWAHHSGWPVYTQFMADYDDICVTRIVKSYIDDVIYATKDKIWEPRKLHETVLSGDLVAECGAEWSYTYQYMTTDLEHQSKCFWMERDPEHDWQTVGASFHWDSLEPVNFGFDRDPKRFCNGIDVKILTVKDDWKIKIHDWNHTTGAVITGGRISHQKHGGTANGPLPIPFLEGPAAMLVPESISPPSKRALKQQADAEELVLSDHKSHSARELCESPRSRGPSLAHHGERLYCDMASRTLYEFCRPGLKEDCFDPEQNKVVTTRIFGVRSSKRAHIEVRDVRRK